MIEEKLNQPASNESKPRREPRVKAGHSTLLNAPGMLPIEAWVLDVSSGGAKLRIPSPLEIGLPIKIEAQDVLLFGTIVRCEQVDGAYIVGIALSRCLEMLTELQKLNASLLTENEPQQTAEFRSNKRRR